MRDISDNVIAIINRVLFRNKVVERELLMLTWKAVTVFYALTLNLIICIVSISNFNFLTN